MTWDPLVPPPQIPGLRYLYRVYRRDAQTEQVSVAGELPVSGEANPTLVDTGFEWERNYDYWVTGVTLIQQASGAERVEGEDTPPVHVVTRDIFPPATPSGLQAVFSGPGQKPFIDLVWLPDTEADLAGYNVYRQEQGGEPVKISTQPVKTPAFRDSAVVAGHEYVYSVSAVDISFSNAWVIAARSSTGAEP